MQHIGFKILKSSNALQNPAGLLIWLFGQDSISTDLHLSQSGNCRQSQKGVESDFT